MSESANETLERLYMDVVNAKKRLVEASRTHEVIEDYTLQNSDGIIKLSALFGDKPDLLLIHNMGKRCSYCTLWADGFIGLYPHLSDRAAFVLTSPDDVATQIEFATSRDWPFPLASVKDSPLPKDLGFEPEPGKHWPGFSALHRQEDGTIIRTGRTHFGPGDDFCAVWPMLDLLKDGPNGWEPKYAYGGVGADGGGCQ